MLKSRVVPTGLPAALAIPVVAGVRIFRALNSGSSAPAALDWASPSAAPPDVGRVGIESEVGKGSRFIFALPKKARAGVS